MTDRQFARTESEECADQSAHGCRLGNAHALTLVWLRDHMVLSSGPIKAADMVKMLPYSLLIGTELNRLIGLMIKTTVGWTLPAAASEEHLDSTDELLRELHRFLFGSFRSGLTKEVVASGSDSFGQGALLMDPFFHNAGIAC